MKTLRFFVTFAVLMAAYAMVSASETSDNFAKWVPDFASSDLNKRKDAQQNWQNLCRQKGNDPAIQKEIIQLSVEQLTKNNPVETTVWIVRQLGIAGDAAAVPALAKCLTDNEVRVRDEAARALANIPGREAENALKNNNVIIAAQLAKDALTARTIKADSPKTATETTLMGIPYVVNSPIAEIQGYDAADNMGKAQILSNFTTRALRQQVDRVQGTDMAATRRVLIPLALDAAKNSDETLRNAGILAVGALGGTAEIPFLLEYAQTGANKDLAKLALSRMSGKTIDNALLAQLKTEENPERFSILADVLNRRFHSEIRPILLDRAQASSTSDRLRLLQLAEPTSTKADVGEFVKVWILITDRGQKDRAEQIIARLSGGDAGSVMQVLGDNWDTPESLSLLGRIGDSNTLDKIKQSKNVARAFSNWPNARIADDLLTVVRDTKYSEEDRIAVLRAFVRVMSLPGTRPEDQIGIQINEAQKIGQLADAYKLATRVEDKRLFIQRAGQVRHADSLRFILKYFDDTELQETVCGSILDLAHQVELKRTAKEEFSAALDKVLSVLDKISDTNRRNEYRNRANRYKTQQ